MTTRRIVTYQLGKKHDRRDAPGPIYPMGSFPTFKAAFNASVSWHGKNKSYRVITRQSIPVYL
jgi:hypothetical protein